MGYLFIYFQGIGLLVCFRFLLAVETLAYSKENLTYNFSILHSFLTYWDNAPALCHVMQNMGLFTGYWHKKRIWISTSTSEYSQIMTLQIDLRYLAFYLHDLAGFLQFSKARSKMPAEIQQLCRCSAFSKISPKSHYLNWVRILVRDLLRNFPAHLCSLVPHHISFLLRAKDKVLLKRFYLF